MALFPAGFWPFRPLPFLFSTESCDSNFAIGTYLGQGHRLCEWALGLPIAFLVACW
jgi:hypothetical protein